MLDTVPQRFVTGSLRWISHACFHGSYERVHIFYSILLSIFSWKRILTAFIFAHGYASFNSSALCVLQSEGVWPHCNLLHKSSKNLEFPWENLGLIWKKTNYPNFISFSTCNSVVSLFWLEVLHCYEVFPGLYK